MELFDIINNPQIRDMIKDLAGKAQQGGGAKVAVATGGNLNEVLGELASKLGLPGGLGGLTGGAPANQGGGMQAPPSGMGGQLGGGMQGPPPGMGGPQVQAQPRQAPGGGGFPGGLPGGLGAGLGGGLLGMILSQMLGGGAAKRGGVGGLGKAAGLAGIAAVALNFYKKWAAAQRARQGGMAAALGDFDGAEVGLDPTSMLLFKAMVFAARADGHIDEAERTRIQEVARGMFPGHDVSPLLNQLTQGPVDPAILARDVQSQEQAEDLYRFSCLIVDVDTQAEAAYLNTLARGLGLDAGVKAQLDREAAAAKAQLASYC